MRKALVTCHSSLYFLYLNFSISLAVALLALVLFTALFLKHYYLFAPAVADDGCLDGRAADLIAGNERLDIDLIALFALDRRHADRLTLGHGKLFSA